MGASHAKAPCHCEPERVGGYEYSQEIGTWFADCVYTPQDKASFAFGMLSVACWAVLLIPQMIETYNRKSVETLSPVFFGLFMVADILNLLSAVWTDQVPTEYYEGLYFVVMDIAVLLQYAYYAHIRDGLQPPDEQELERRRNVPPSIYGFPRMTLKALFAGALFVAARFLPHVLTLSGAVGDGPRGGAGRALLQAPAEDDSLLCNHHPQLSESQYAFGHFAAWGAAVLYALSRVPQIYKNHVTRDELTLAPLLIVLALAGNGTYFVSIMLRVPDTSDEHFTRDTLPFIVGSAGTFVLDAIILCQLTNNLSARRKGYRRVNTSEADAAGDRLDVYGKNA